MSQKKKRQVSKGTGKRFTSNKPHPQITTPVRVLPPPPSYAETALRKRISQFGLSERFRDDFELAIEQYMGPGIIQKQGDKKTLVFDEETDDWPGFQEWFFFDYVLRSGDRIIDIFATEMGPELSGLQRQILADWIATNRLRLLETQSGEPGIGETMQDLLSEEELHLNDISFSYSASQWMIALVRPILTEGRWHFTGSGILLTPFEKPRMMKTANDLWSGYQKKHPNAGPLDFYRDHSLDLLRVGKEIQAERGKPKQLLTAEKHAVVSATSEFEIKGDARQVEESLNETEEFILVNEQKGGKFAGSLHYIWLLRGRSVVPEAPKDQLSSEGLMLSGSWTAGPGMPDYKTLGDLYLSKRGLTLSCMSRERLEAGKQLLIEILDDKIYHPQDHFEEFKQQFDDSDLMDEEEYLEHEIKDDREEEMDDESEIVEQEMIECETLRWLDTPDQKGVTPRQAAQTLEGREELRETLKKIEFMGEQATSLGKSPPMRLDLIRNELGL
jgi:hypothetical protein